MDNSNQNEEKIANFSTSTDDELHVEVLPKYDSQNGKNLFKNKVFTSDKLSLNGPEKKIKTDFNSQLKINEGDDDSIKKYLINSSDQTSLLNSDNQHSELNQTSISSEETNNIVKPAYLNADDTATSLIWRICKTKTQKIFQKISYLATNRTLRIGISARIFHPEPGAKGLRGKTLQYLEECLAHWIMSRDVIVFMIPTVAPKGSMHYSNISLRDYAKQLDGLVLQGGADISPLSYGEKATQPEWSGDQIRDLYELDLCRSFIELGKPVFGICRGCQLINVAFGGTLYQDIASEHPNPKEHVKESYDLHHHTIELIEGSSFAQLFNKENKKKQWVVNSIHHQAVKNLGKNIQEEAISSEDGITEAIRYTKAPFVVGIQWHPEFYQAGINNLLDCTPLLDQFLRAARETRF